VRALAARAIDVTAPMCVGCAKLAATVATLEQRIAALEAARPRDVLDTELRRLLPVHTRNPETGIMLPFRTGDLLCHARDHAPDLYRALQAATIQTAGELGCWLRGQVGTRDGVHIERRGKRWLATWAT